MAVKIDEKLLYEPTQNPTYRFYYWYDKEVSESGLSYNKENIQREGVHVYSMGRKYSVTISF